MGPIITIALLALAVVCVATGFLPPPDTGALIARIAPVLGFVVAITIVAELGSEAGVFEALAERMGRWGRGRVVALWASVIVLAVLSTAFLSLDTTAVLVTPVVVLLAQRVGISPIPFALAAVWLANTASLLLPVSNLTNLLATDRIGGGAGAFLALSWAPALIGIAVPVVLLSILYRRSLTGSYTVAPVEPADDRVLLVVSAVVTVVLLPMLVITTEVWIPASIAAVVLLVLFAVRRRSVIRVGLIPWNALGIALALFVLVETAHAHGLEDLLASVAGTGTGPLDLLRLAALGALGANGINNLPAYLVLEPQAAGDPLRLMALLIGVNLGPLVSPWASLATLLWHDRVVSLGVTVRWGRFALMGLLAVAIMIPLATVVLALVH
ncbi:SLC13 family permease [Cnuibacter sp. UC19_7]|uniref:SLC13 family permease n=1 Tax=Cnuibacter sp. UC19_7 TaxID=3350166 RepID=UPI003670765E